MDANVLFTAAHNPSGKAALVIELGRQGYWHVLTSTFAIEEARRNLERKYPNCLRDLESLLTNVEQVPSGKGSQCPIALPEKDQPILEAAIRNKATHLLTGDARDFGRYMDNPEISAGVTIQTVSRVLASL